MAIYRSAVEPELVGSVHEVALRAGVPVPLVVTAGHVESEVIYSISGDHGDADVLNRSMTFASSRSGPVKLPPPKLSRTTG